MGKRYKWSRERILEEIRNLHQQGLPLNMASVRRIFPSLVATACSKRYFGSWQAAVKAAGFDYDEIIQVKRWTKEQVIDGIRQIYNSGGDLRPSMVAKVNQMMLVAAKRFFGGWREAVMAAGIDYDAYVDQKRQSKVEQEKEQILSEIQRLYREGLIEELSGAWRYHLPLFRKARHRFGSWKKAIEAAGLNYNEVVQRQKWTREKIITEIIRLYNEGKDLSVTSMQRTYPNLVAIAQSPRYFGSWRAAVEAAGFDYELIKRQRGRRRREPIQVKV
ncbi:MAG: hypothetical protein NZ937_04510 [Armatimonadetes bacterium]|nr:hypothetical protein [Armatimonadota bacterium]